MRDALRKQFLRFRPGAWLIGLRRKLMANAKFKRQFTQFAKINNRFPIEWKERMPCLNDATPNTDFDAHYIFHTAWAARHLANLRPEIHIDISSSLYFSSIVSAFVPVSFYDYRPVSLGLSGMESNRGDLMALPFADKSVLSISCMHVVEHVGLGRYGEPLDPNGDIRAMRELERVLAPGGSLFFVVPVGRSRIMFNAHRIYSVEQIIAAFPELALKEFSLIPDFPRLEIVFNASHDLANSQEYGCGCFRFTRSLE